MLEDEEQNLKTDSKKSKAIEIIRKGVNKTSKIMQALLSFTGTKAEGKELIDIHEIVDNTLLFLRYNFPDGLNIFKSYDLNVEVPVYKEKIQKVILSILENAVSAIKENEHLTKEYIKIKTYKEDCYLGECGCIAITNSGPLISADHLSKIFDPFFTTKNVGEGTGLGMAISYMFMKEHEGLISVENVPEGVCFIVKFPLSSTEKPKKKSFPEFIEED